MTSTIELAVGARDLTEVIAKSGNRWMGGYGWGERRSVGSCAERPPLRAQCAVIRDANGPKVWFEWISSAFHPAFTTRSAARWSRVASYARVPTSCSRRATRIPRQRCPTIRIRICCSDPKR